MAKKQNTMAFSDIFSKLENISKKTAIRIETNNNKRTFIDTGIYIFNALLSGSIKSGGVSKNNITILAGPTSVGKSYIAYNVIRNAQKDGYRVLFIDTEFAIMLSDLEKFGRVLMGIKTHKSLSQHDTLLLYHTLPFIYNA